MVRTLRLCIIYFAMCMQMGSISDRSDINTGMAFVAMAKPIHSSFHSESASPPGLVSSPLMALMKLDFGRSCLLASTTMMTTLGVDIAMQD